MRYVRLLTLLLQLGLLVLSVFNSAVAKASNDSVKSSQSAIKADSVAKDKEKKGMQKAIFGAGCFWGVEETFRDIPGVVSTTVGYCGGTMKNPTYEDVCTDRTGHAECVLVEYDPSKVSYEKLLDVFWTHHNPTSLNFQGPDHGTQYRSVIFYTTPEQEAEAKASKRELEHSGRFKSPIVTQIELALPFYKAEEYHQKYLEKHGMRACH
jgi:peptide-methionine (S)-S-oxide reductase